MLNYLRLVNRLIGFGLISLCSFLEFCLIGNWLRGTTRHAYQGRWLRRYSKLICWLVGMKVRQIGEPQPAAFLVSNHLGYLDPFLIASQAPVIWVAKYEIRSWPWGGILTRCGGTIYIKREQRSDVSRVIEEIREVIESKTPVGLFLEGTTSDGSQVMPFHPGLLQPAVNHKWAVQPCTINYRVPETGSAEGVSWYGSITLLPHLLKLLQYPKIEAEIYFDKPVISENRKELAAELHSVISHQLKKSRASLAAPDAFTPGPHELTA